MSLSQTEFDARLRSEASKFLCAGRNQSAAFLIWYLRNLFRLDEQEAIDSVCDGLNDKGIDGIYVDEDDEAIYVFQSKFSPSYRLDQGDNDLRNFTGTRAWFQNGDSVRSLLESTANEELKSLVMEKRIQERVAGGFDVYLQFVTNKVFDTNAKEFLSVSTEFLESHDLNDIFQSYTYFADRIASTGPTTILLSNRSKIEYRSENGIVASIYVIAAKELLKLQGIQDRTLFYRNVRYSLGSTRVNREIKKTIVDASQHGNFFLYHNGITVICDSITPSDGGIVLINYSIINGCQSMITLYENRDKISDRMYILVKIISLEQNNPLVHDITYYTNNQNSITLQDLKSDDRTQKTLRSEFEGLFGRRVFYRIKRGDLVSPDQRVIDTDYAAQLVEAFYEKHPDNAARKSILFGERYSEIFSRHTTASRIYFAHLVHKVVEENNSGITNEQVRSYGLAMFFFVYVLGEILRSDTLGGILIEDPTDIIRSSEPRLEAALRRTWELLIPDVNAFVEDYTRTHNNFFDYKNLFKNREFVASSCRRLVADNQRILVRHPEDAFNSIYESVR